MILHPQRRSYRTGGKLFTHPDQRGGGKKIKSGKRQVACCVNEVTAQNNGQWLLFGK